MPPRPFPFAFRVGTDICHVLRVRAIITRSEQDNPPLFSLKRFLNRILTDHERLYFWKRFAGGTPTEEIFDKTDTISRYLAGRFAAKEACRKACVYLGSNTRGYQSIIILPVKIPAVGEHQSVRPLGLILDAAYENRFGSMDKPVDGTVVRKSFVRSSVDVDELDGQLCEISISHDGDYATASAIVPYMDARVAAKRGVQRQRSDVASTSRDLSGSQREEEEAYW